LDINDVISLITLRANDKGVGYNFGELWPVDPDPQT